MLNYLADFILAFMWQYIPKIIEDAEGDEYMTNLSGTN